MAIYNSRTTIKPAVKITLGNEEVDQRIEHQITEEGTSDPEIII